MPKFSIITINFNNFAGLQKTMQSIFFQTFREFEYIVVDGGSTDGSVETIQQFNSRCLSGSTIQQFNWISEPDNGIYHAMNKGIKMATGQYLLFLNSGDELINNEVLMACANRIEPETELCSGVLTMVDGEKETIVNPLPELSLYYCMYDGLTHPNTFIRKSLFETYGLYNEKNKIASDWEFFLITAGLHNITYQAINIPIARFYMDGISSNPNDSTLANEIKYAIERHIPAPILKDMERIRQLESKMSDKNFRILDAITMKSPRIAKLIFSQLRLINFLLKKIK